MTEQLSNFSSRQKTPEWEDKLLCWFCRQGAPLIERKLSVGGLKYYHFSTFFEMPHDRKITAYGRSRDRREAAVKCVAEYAERRWLTEIYSSNTSKLFLGLPSGLRTSNGWAVQRSSKLAREGAFAEALQRHLLLKSFLVDGWDGFHKIKEIKAGHLSLQLLSSRFRCNSKVAGMVVAKSALYPGIAMGYGRGSENEIESSSFWEPAIYEACDQILTLNGAPVSRSHNPNSWVIEGIRHFLETPFDLMSLGNNPRAIVQEREVDYQTCTFDLSKEWGLDFEFHAAFAYGGNLIPLYESSHLRATDISYLKEVFARNKITCNLYQRHPIL